MAATTRLQQAMPLLRRPLPPKPLQNLPKSPSPPPKGIHEDIIHENLSKSPVIPSLSRSKHKQFPERLYSGDVPLPDTSVVQPYRPRGPAPLPARQPRKVRELPEVLSDSYERPPPAFTLKNFVLRVPSRVAEENREIVISDQNYEKLTSWFAANRPQQTNIHSLEIDTSVNVPDVTPRIPPRQLSIEMKVPIAEMEKTVVTAESGYSIYAEKVAKMTPVTPAVSKRTIPPMQKPLPPIDHRSEHNRAIEYEKTEIKLDDLDIKKQILQYEGPEVKTTGQSVAAQKVGTFDKRLQEQACGYDKDQGVKTRKLRINFRDDIEGGVCVREGDEESEDSLMLERPTLMERGKASSLERPKIVAFPNSDLLLPSSAPSYFQGEGIPRTSSPFVTLQDYHTQVSPLEAVILNTLMTQTTTLNIKAHFLSRLPTLVQMSDHITHVNASFNDFWVFPPEILDLKLLVSLKLRNNPIKEIPHGISSLKYLKVLDMSFSLVNSIPSCLFELTDLEILDLSYNRISFVPTEVGNLRNLRELNLEGNQIRALPANILYLRLKYLKISNNFIHPLFWRETASNQPQRLMDLCALVVNRTKQNSLKMALLPDSIKSFLKSPYRCDCCGGVLLGQGLRVIKPVDEAFKVKNLPLLFSSCSQPCRKRFIKNRDAIELWLLRNDIFNNKHH
ncbi:uncharacterized protein LOC116292017 [Actinia tenebrosa]|uniref:Uncharacterized protein LOC116292017 n=1 Tax=Actinia tenebrosa TaxID=6105 RepID=A0A6P8HR46_ACTTE|nr:uncharacterized protein LOC116292017 [Actinia tenebrosa]